MKELNWVPVPVHCRVMSQIWNCHTSGVSGISGRGIVVRGMTWHEVVVVGVFIVVPERTRDIQRETRQTVGHALEGGLRRIAREAIFTLRAKLERPATAACSADGSTQHLLRGHGTICSDVTSTDALAAVGEDDCLETGLVSFETEKYE